MVLAPYSSFPYFHNLYYFVDCSRLFMHFCRAITPTTWPEYIHHYCFSPGLSLFHWPADCYVIIECMANAMQELQKVYNTRYRSPSPSVKTDAFVRFIMLYNEWSQWVSLPCIWWATNDGAWWSISANVFSCQGYLCESSKIINHKDGTRHLSSITSETKKKNGIGINLLLVNYVYISQRMCPMGSKYAKLQVPVTPTRSSSVAFKNLVAISWNCCLNPP